MRPLGLKAFFANTLRAVKKINPSKILLSHWKIPVNPSQLVLLFTLSAKIINEGVKQANLALVPVVPLTLPDLYNCPLSSALRVVRAPCQHRGTGKFMSKDFTVEMQILLLPFGQSSCYDCGLAG